MEPRTPMRFATLLLLAACAPESGTPDPQEEPAPEGCPVVDTWPDHDRDGFGAGSTTRSGCVTEGWAAVGGDCNDNEAAVNPAAEDVCNGVDDDCDGEKEAADAVWYADADGDGYGEDTTGVQTCSPSAGWVTLGGDCADGDPGVNPGAEEACNGVDDNCDGTSDLGYEADWHSDADGDGYGSPLQHEVTCVPTAGWVLDGTDCRPSDAAAYPGAPEACNGADDSCDGVVDEGFDKDGDGHFDEACSFGDDCDETDPETYLDAHESCGDGVDQDCDGLDLHCGYTGSYALVDADVRASNSSTAGAGGHLDHGDFDGDGFEDVIVNALVASAVVVVHGPLSGAVDLEVEGTYFTGDGSVAYGARSIGVGDVDGDGLDDVGFGSPYGTGEGLYILYGPADTDTTADNADVYLGAPAGTYAGHGADISDVTGDGVADGIVGAYSAQYHGGTGLTYVWNGPLAGEYDLDDVDSFIYDSTGDGYAGRWERSDGDVNGDGVNDLLVAAPWASGSAYYGGIVYLVLGPPPTALDLASADARILGTTMGGYLGEYRAMKFGDADGDGVDDTLVSAYTAGEAAIFLGALAGDYDMSAGDVTFADATYFGSGLDLEDIDGNGRGDALMSNEYAGDGESYLFWDVSAGAYTSADAAATFLGESGSYTGSSSCFADLTGDGWLDVVVAAEGLDTTGGFYVEAQVH